METPLAPTSERKKLLRSCTACRKSKTRCSPNADDDDCQRCRRLGKPCIFAEARGRAKGAKRCPPSKLALVEKRINDLYSLLQTDGSAQRESSSGPLHELCTAMDSTTNMEVSGPSTESTEIPASSMASTTPSSPVMDGCANAPDVIERGIVSYEEADDLLAFFKRHWAWVSFVWPVDDPDLDLMRQKHPITLLVVLMVAHLRDPSVRKLLERELKEVVSRRVFIDSSKDLELLRGLLLYSLWYGVYPNENMSYLYTLGHLLATLCGDLNISSHALSQRSTADKLDLSRISLVTYLTANSTAMMLRRPLPVPYGEGIKADLRLLMQAKQGPSDEFVIREVRLQKIKEDIANVFRYENPAGYPLDVETVEMFINAYARDLEAIQDSDPITDPQFRTHMELSIRHTWVYLYEVALHMNQSSAKSSPSSKECGVTSAATRRTNMLIRSLEKTIECAEYYVQLPSLHLERHTAIHRCQLAHTATMMLKLSFNTANGTPQNPFPLHKACNFSHYLKLLANQCKDHDPSQCDGQCVARDPIGNFRDRLRQFKVWNDRTDFFGGAGGDDILRDMSTVMLEEIAKQEEQMLALDWGVFDPDNVDMSML